MLRSFRRSSSKDIATLRNGGVTLILQPPNTGASTHDYINTPPPVRGHISQLSFFDLPPEIRNTIYDLLIAESTLSLPASIIPSSKRPRIPLKLHSKPLPTIPINGLLLASKQCRREYLSMLFSRATIAVEVEDFDFEGLTRVTSALDEAEERALISNPDLTIQLVLRNCRPRGLQALRKWLDFRASHPVRLPWRYEFAMERLLPATTNGRIRLLRELAYYADTISVLAPQLRDAQRAELGLVVAALMDRVEWLEQDVGRLGERSYNHSRNVRGLAGGGWV